MYAIVMEAYIKEMSMKYLFISLLIIGLAAPLFAQTDVPAHTFAFGDWSFDGPRLYQNDTDAAFAKVMIRIPQYDAMIYEFNIKYEGGAEDGHGGVGIHLYVDNTAPAATLGAGNSYLLWLNYDVAPNDQDIPQGFSAQVYKSIDDDRMILLHSISLDQYFYLLTEENLAHPIPFLIEVYETGEIRIYDPTDPEMRVYYHFTIDNEELPLRGNWIVLRTNGMRASFSMGLDQ